MFKNGFNLLLILSIFKNKLDKNMSLKDKAKATAKNIEGKIQETYGDVIGSPKNQAEGQAKQMEAKVKQSIEDVKDEAKKAID
jgi:uncharacterized protein YjbJ (UPF0337 family)